MDSCLKQKSEKKACISSSEEFLQFHAKSHLLCYNNTNKKWIGVDNEDRSGIVAGVSTKIAELGLNIDDISQTVLDEFFTMMAVVSSEEKQDFAALRSEFESFGQTLNVKINIQSAAIFDAMYNI